MKKKTIALLCAFTIALPFSLTAFANEVEEDYSNVSAMALPERTAPLVDYQQDLQELLAILNTANLNTLKGLGGEGNVFNEEENQKAIVLIQDINKAISSKTFKTDAGNTVKAALIAFNNASVDTISTHAKWQNNRELQVQISENIAQLNQDLLQAILDLKYLAEE
mgnify:CR=1 FL=1